MGREEEEGGDVGAPQGGDSLAVRLALDMEALSLLYPSDADLRMLIDARVLDQADEHVRRVVGFMTSERAPANSMAATVLVSLGELVLASFLMISGLAALAALLFGATSPARLVSYFSAASLSPSSVALTAASSPVYVALPAIEAILSVLLILSALVALRRASKTLKSTRFSPGSV